MAWIARLIAALVAGVIADAAVASVHATGFTFLTAGAGAILAIVVLASTWSRPAILLAANALILTGVFAAGTLDGVDAGPALTGVSPTDAAAIVFAAAILTATAAVLARNAHLLLRAVAAAAGLYAAAATLAAVRHGGLAAAFDTAPLAWTRGSYVGAEVLLPFAAVAALVYAVAQFVRRRAAYGTAALLFACAFAAASQLGAAAAGAAGQPTIVAFEHRSGIAASGRGGTLTDAAAVQPGDLPAVDGPLFTPAASAGVPPEVAAAAAGIAPDAAHALAAVAGLGNDLYAGALGGSAGALRTGSANSIDKALLLRDVFRARMPAVETGFARCTLAPVDADALVAQVRSAHGAHPRVAMQSAAAAIDSANDPAMKAALQRWAQTWKMLVQQTQDGGRTLGTELRLAGITLPADRPAPERLRALAAPHVWLRARLDGTWTDLDPTIAGALPGKTRCVADNESATLADDAYDVLGVRIVIERYVDGRPERATVFERTVRTAELGDRDLSFMFAEPVGIDPGAATAAAVPATPAAAAASAALVLTPLLRVGNEQLAGTPFSLPAPAGAKNSVATAISSVADALQAQPAPTLAGTTAPLPVIGGVWMELSVRGPGVLTTVRNPIFDRVGVAARAAHATPPALAAQPEGAAYAALQTIWNVAVSAGHGTSAGGPAESAPSNDVPAISAALARAHGAYYAVRRSLADDARGTRVDVVADRPGISLLALTNSGTFIDIASDDALPIGDNDARPLWAAASVLAERHVVNAEALLRSGSVDAAGARDALATFADATASGARVVALVSPSDAVGPAAVPDDARVRMSAHLARGASLLALASAATQRSAAPYAYWVIDPERGTLRDENADGRHQAAAEEGAVDNEVAIKNISTWRKFTCTILPVIRAATFALSVAHNASPFSPGAVGGLGAANAAATQKAVDDAQAGLDRPVCAGS